MSRRWPESQVPPDDEVMPYSDDETDDELEVSSEEEPEDAPPGVPPPQVEAKPSGESLKADLGLHYELHLFGEINFVSHLFSRPII